MQFVFSDDVFPQQTQKSIFLAGPSPRGTNVDSWRHEAIKILEKLNFDGTVYIPLPKNVFLNIDSIVDYDAQIKWECLARSIADCIIFWIPRSIKNLPGFTTNVEFGEDLNSGKVLYGRPDSAEKCRYLDVRFADKGTIFSNLEELLSEAVRRLGQGVTRKQGEMHVPLHIWKTPSFQNWYTALLEAGNTLLDAKVLWHFAINNNVFSYILWVNVWVEKEKRCKSNEFIFSRTDISTVVAYHKNKVVLIREFRSPVSNKQGFVYELPGGSSFKPNMDPLVNARKELHEETSLFIEDLSRFNHVSTKQLCATLSTHKAHIYSVELTKEEIEYLENKSNESFGAAQDSEKTYVVVQSLNNITVPVDYSTLGMIYEAINK